jgi:hypothetical protein
VGLARLANHQITSGSTDTVSDTEVAETQEVDAPEPQEGTEGLAQEATPQAQDVAAEVDEKALARAKELRSENASLRRRLKAIEEDQRKRDEADMTDQERTAKEAADLRTMLEKQQAETRSLALESAVAMRANTLGIVDAEAAVKLLDTGALDFDDIGRPDPESLDMALKRLIKAKPYLKTQPPAASPANPARTEPAGETDAQRRARLFGGGGGIFDVDTARSLGGGVLNPDS